MGNRRDSDEKHDETGVMMRHSCGESRQIDSVVMNSGDVSWAIDAVVRRTGGESRSWDPVVMSSITETQRWWIVMMKQSGYESYHRDLYNKTSDKDTAVVEKSDDEEDNWWWAEVMIPIDEPNQ